VKGSVDELVSCFQRYLDLAHIGIDVEGLMLGEYGWREHDSEGEDGEGFHCISKEGFEYRFVALALVDFSWWLPVE
jgi:hypothetical protein